MKESEIEEMNEKFELFLFEMDDVLESINQFVESLNRPEFLPLDYSWESLDKIEKLYAELLDGKLHVKEEDEELNPTRIGRYIGETLRKNVGGKWILCTEEKNVDFGFPRIGEIRGMIPDYAWNPLRVLKTFKVRLLPGLIRKAAESHLEFIK